VKPVDSVGLLLILVAVLVWWPELIQVSLWIAGAFILAAGIVSLNGAVRLWWYRRQHRSES
jgi:fucose permease